MSIRRPGWPMSWPASPGIRPTGLMSCCRGIGGRTRPRAVRQPDYSGDQRRLHDRLRRQSARRGRRLAARPADQHVPEDGCLWVHGVGEDRVPVFTRDGIENLRQIIADERAASCEPARQAGKVSPPAALTACLRSSPVWPQRSWSTRNTKPNPAPQKNPHMATATTAPSTLTTDLKLDAV